MFEAIALTGGFWFFLFVVFVLIAGIVSNEMDSFFGGGLTLVMLAGGSQFLFGIPVWSSIVANPFLVILGIVVYTAIGIAYGVFIRYAEFLNDNADRIKSHWNEYRRDNPNATTEDFRKSSYYRNYTPSFNADKIVLWVTLWPWGALWDLSHKPIRYVYNNLYGLTGRLLDAVGARISDRIINNDRK